MTALDSILKKADKVEVGIDDKLDKEDIDKCKVLEKELKKFLDFAKGYIKHLDNNYEPIKDIELLEYDYDLDKLKRNMQNKIKEKIERFMRKIINYFEEKYNITFQNKNNFIEENRDNEDIEYQIIVEEIFNQLGGMSFKEKAKKELKEKWRNNTTNSYNKIQVKNNRISISDYMNYGHNIISEEIEINHRTKDDLNLLTEILSLYEYNSSDTTTEFIWFRNHLINASSPQEFIKKNMINSEKIEGIRLYKNQKIVIYFQKPKYAREFGREYMKLDV